MKEKETKPFHYDKIFRIEKLYSLVRDNLET